MDVAESTPAEAPVKKSEPKKTFVLKKWTGVALWHFGDDTNADCGICRSSKQDYCTIPHYSHFDIALLSVNEVLKSYRSPKLKRAYLKHINCRQKPSACSVSLDSASLLTHLCSISQAWTAKLTETVPPMTVRIQLYSLFSSTRPLRPALANSISLLSIS